MADSKVALTQHTATHELKLSAGFQAAMKIGHIRRGEFDAARSQIENHLIIHEMIESGEYKDVVAQAAASGIKFDGIEPRDVFFKLMGISTATYERREKEVRALGIETVKSLRQIGVPYREIRMLADGPQELRAEIQKRAKSNDITPEYVEVITSKLIEQTEARLRAQESAKAAEAQREKAEEKLKKAAERVIDQSEEIKKLHSELRDARQNRRAAAEKEIDALVERAMKLVRQGAALLGDCDFETSPYARARCVEVVAALRTVANNLQIENVAAFEQAD